MKKLIALLLVMMLVVPFAAFAEDGTYEIALITDVGNIDDHSFNQASWEGVKEFAEANNITYAYYQPFEDSDDARLESMHTAIDKGAKVLVTPGFMFGAADATIAAEYPDVKVLFIDSAADIMVALDNVHNVMYQEEQAGYLAGYAAVKDGYKQLGFLGGMAVPAVVRYGYGFVQGADAAAKEMGLTDVNVKYWYCGAFGPSDETKTKMAGWYTEGTEVVFACGGKIYLSAIAAAEQANAKVIGVDVDQAFDSDLIVTSAMKGLGTSVISSLTALYANDMKWPEDMAGKLIVLGAKDNGVGLPTAETSWRLNTYTVAEYEALFAKLQAGEIEISAATDAAPAVEVITVDYQE